MQNDAQSETTMPSETSRALIVDDDRVIRKLIGLALHKQGFVCEQASDGAEALRLIQDKTFDIVITDLKMPGFDGHSLAVELLQRSERPVVMVLTGVVNPPSAADLISRGIDEMAYKPMSFRELAAKATGLVRKRQGQLAAAARCCDDLPVVD